MAEPAILLACFSSGFFTKMTNPPKRHSNQAGGKIHLPYPLSPVIRFNNLVVALRSNDTYKISGTKQDTSKMYWQFNWSNIPWTLGQWHEDLKTILSVFLANAHEGGIETKLFLPPCVWDGEGRIHHYLQGLQILSFVTFSKNSP